jgi:hypothetical protein
MKVVASVTILAELEEGWTPCLQVVTENHSSGELTFSRGCAGVHPLGSKTTFKMWNIVNEVVWPNRLPAGSSLTLMTRLSELKTALRQQNFVAVQTLSNAGTDFVLVRCVLILYALADEARARKAIAW